MRTENNRFLPQDRLAYHYLADLSFFIFLGNFLPKSQSFYLIECKKCVIIKYSVVFCKKDERWVNDANAIPRLYRNATTIDYTGSAQTKKTSSALLFINHFNHCGNRIFCDTGHCNGSKRQWRAS